jgi:hypothetical protein
MSRLARIACCLAAVVALIGAGQQFQSVTGTWALERSGYSGRWQLQLSSHGNTNSMQWQETMPIPARPSSTDFTIAREAGTFHFTGTLSSDGGTGQFTFTPSEAFVSGLAARNLQIDNSHEIMSAASVDVTLAYIDSIHAAGYRDLRFGDLLAFRALGVTTQSIAQLRGVFGQMPAGDVISTTALHVTPQYVQELRSMGMGPVTAERAVTFKALHIDKSYIAELARLGYAHMDPQDIVSFKAMHIDAAYLEHLRQHGLKNLTPQQVIQMKAAGL